MIDSLALLEAEFPLFVLITTLCFGLLVGSFLNVVIYRLPAGMQVTWRTESLDFIDEELRAHDPGSSQRLKEIRDTLIDPDAPTESIVSPGSRCPQCGNAIRPWNNIPVISYLVLRGRCADCGVSISARYPIVELATGLIAVAVINQFGLNPAGITALILSFGLIALAMIDYDTKLLPDDITLPLLWLGLLVNAFAVHTTLFDAVLGASCGYLVLWLVFQGFRLVTGKDGMGYGDFKLLALLGAWLGWQFLPMIVILSSFAGAVIGGVLILSGRDRNNPIPFGPYLAVAGWVSLLWGDVLLAEYLQFMTVDR